MGSSPHLRFCACKTATLGPDLLVCMGPRPHLRFCAFKGATLGPELYVSIGPSKHLWFMHAKQRLLDQNTSLYGNQTSPVVLCMHNGVVSTRITSLYGFQPSSVVFACKTESIGPEIQVCMGPRHRL